MRIWYQLQQATVLLPAGQKNIGSFLTQGRGGI